MPSSPILLLDVMSTLVSEPFYEDVPRFLGLELEELRRRRNHEAFLDFERGLIDEAEYGRRFFTDGELLDVVGMKRTLAESVELLPGVEPALERLSRAGVRMYALSNYSEWYQVIDGATGLSRWLDWSFVSCRTGRRKPEPEAYLGPCRVLSVQPADCLFVDDRAKNVEAARAVGMDALLCTEQTNLETEFERRGLI